MGFRRMGHDGSMGDADRAETSDGPNEPTRGHHRVVAAVLHRRGEVLLCHRRPDSAWYPSVWDLPGGHVEPGEHGAEALVRELREELAIIVQAPNQPPLLSGMVAADTHLTVWAIDTWSGDVVNNAPDEHDGIDWFDRTRLVTVDIADPAITELCMEVLASGDRRP